MVTGTAAPRTGSFSSASKTPPRLRRNRCGSNSAARPSVTERRANVAVGFQLGSGNRRPSSHAAAAARCTAAVGVLARPTGFHQGEQRRLAERDPSVAHDVVEHAIGEDDQAVHHPRHVGEHEVQQPGGVGEDDALGRRMRDVPFVPERDVLQGRPGRAPGSTRASPLMRSHTTGFRLCGMALEPFWPVGERLLHLAHLGAGQVADLGGDAVQRGGHDASVVMNSACRSRWITWVLASSARRPSRAQTSSSTRGSIAA